MGGSFESNWNFKKPTNVSSYLTKSKTLGQSTKIDKQTENHNTIDNDRQHLTQNIKINKSE